jgi:hypothetical protein
MRSKCAPYREELHPAVQELFPSEKHLVRDKREVAGVHFRFLVRCVLGKPNAHEVLGDRVNERMVYRREWPQPGVPTYERKKVFSRPVMPCPNLRSITYIQCPHSHIRS